MATTAPVCRKASTIRSLCSGLTRAYDRHPGNRGRARLVRQLLEFPAGDGAAVFGDAKFLGDDRGRPRVIASDHKRTNPGASRSRNRFSGFGPRRVDHADQPGEHQVVLHAFIRATSVCRKRVAR
jgi:hypothetical protein